MDQKVKLIQEAIDKHATIQFDYVSKEFAVSHGRKGKPLHFVNEKYVWVHMQENDPTQKDKRLFLLDGIQNVTIITGYIGGESSEKDASVVTEKAS